VADGKLVVIDVDVFEKVYQTEHVPLAVAKLAGKTKIVATKILGCPDGPCSFPPHCRGRQNFNRDQKRDRSW